MSAEKVVIIGGGVTGLIAAYFAAKAGKKVVVVEVKDQVGGLLSTFELNGNQLEHYYHHFFTHDTEINWLLKDLGLEEELIFKSSTMGVFRDGKVYPFNGPMDLLRFRPINFIDKIRFVLSSLFLGKVAKWEKYEDIACAEWFNNWAGKSTTKALWLPLLKVKFGPYAEQVPLSWMVGRMRQRLNSRKNGDEKLGYINGSLRTLLDKLTEKLQSMGVELMLNAPLEEFSLNDQKQIDHIIAGGKKVEGSQFLLTAPGVYLHPIMKPYAPKTAEMLENIKYFGAVCVILELSKPLSNIYWLNIADEAFPFGGVIEHTNLVDAKHYGGSHIVYLSRYFAREEDIATMSEEEIKEKMIGTLPRIFIDFDASQIKNVFVFKTNTAATVCDQHFSRKVPDCQTEISNLYLGNMAHVYPDERSVNNSIRIAAEACRVMNIDTSYVSSNQSLSAQIGFSS